MKTNMRALQTFSGPDGNHTKDDIFQAQNAERVRFLTEGGYAALMESDAERALRIADEVKTTLRK